MSKTVKEKSIIKILAADAKARLKNNYYNKENKTDNTDYHQMVMSSFIDSRAFKKENEFNQKVIKILEDGDITNPISRLVDNDYLQTLSYSAKQRYLLEISEKFNKIKNQIQNNKK